VHGLASPLGALGTGPGRYRRRPRNTCPREVASVRGPHRGPQEDADLAVLDRRPCPGPAAAPRPGHPLLQGLPIEGPHRSELRWGAPRRVSMGSPRNPVSSRTPIPSGSPKVSHPKACRRSRAASTSQSTRSAAAACGLRWHPPPPRPPANRSCARPGGASPAGTWPPAHGIPAERTGRRSARGKARSSSVVTTSVEAAPTLPERQALGKCGGGTKDGHRLPGPAGPDLLEQARTALHPKKETTCIFCNYLPDWRA